jgi:hypothetical protein
MKALIAILFLCISASVPAADAANSVPPSTSLQGEVLETKDVENYTYLRLKTRDGETWAAIARAQVRKGARVTIENVMVMNNFESKSLKRKFQTIYFGNLAGAGTSASMAGNAMPAGHPSISRPIDSNDIHVAKASGADARTVMEIVTRSADLKDKTVLVRGKVVKYNPGIMGRNWIHLRDGTGTDAEGTNDVLVTSTSEVKTGDIVTAKGIVRTNKDFGAGYSYKVLIEEATIQ